MKKKTAIISGVFCVMSTLVCLGGCHSRVNAPETTTEKQDVFQSGEFSDNVNEIAKAQKIVVVPIKDESGAVSEDTENEVVITDKDEVRKFADKLTDNITGWKPCSLPEDAVPDGKFIFYVQETLKAGQKPEDRKYVKASEMNVYKESSCVTVQMDSVLDLSVNLEVPQETADYLSGFFES